MTAINKKLITDILITLVYAFLMLFVVLHHEVWVDEVQVWQIAKNLNLLELFKHLTNEGHPALLYLLVMPFAKLGADIVAMQLICWLASVLGVFMLLQFSPFKWWCKLSIILSAGFLYYFPVIARGYSLLPFLVFLLATFYPKRKEQPILYAVSLFIISQVHVIMFVFVSLLTLYFVLEAKKENRINKNTVISFLIMCFGLLAVVLQLCPTIWSNSAISNTVNTNKVLIYNFFVEFFANTLNDMSKVVIPFISFVLWGYFLFMIGALFKKSQKMFWLVLLSVGFQIGIYVTVYPAFIYGTRIFSAFLILIFAYWIVLNDIEEENSKSNILLNVLLSIFFLMSVFNGVLNCVREINLPYSGSKPMADFIKNNVDANNSSIFYQQPNVMAPFFYYLDNYDLFYAPYMEKPKFVVWDERLNRLMPPQNWKKFLEEYSLSNPSKDIYVLQRTNLYTPIENTDIIFISQGYKANWENYVLLKFNPRQ